MLEAVCRGGRDRVRSGVLKLLPLSRARASISLHDSSPLTGLLCRLLPGHCLFTACSGAANIVSYEIITRLACRDVGLPSLPLLALEVRSEFTTTWRGLVDAPNLASEDAEWLHRCHLSSDVHKLTTRFGSYLPFLRRGVSIYLQILLVTMNMCVAGILAAATSSYWGGVSDRKGRLPVLGMAALSDIVNSAGQLL